jgi:hypothetical protein
VVLGSILLALAGGALALYFGESVRQLDAIMQVYDGYLDDDIMAVARPVSLGVGITGLSIAGILVLLSLGTLLGRRAARIWAMLLGVTMLCCCGPAIAFESLGEGVGGTGLHPSERAELDGDLAAVLPQWYQQFTGTFALVVLGSLGLAMVMLLLPSANRFFYPRAQPPYPYPAYYPHYPRYYGYPPGR